MSNNQQYSINAPSLNVNGQPMVQGGTRAINVQPPSVSANVPHNVSISSQNGQLIEVPEYQVVAPRTGINGGRPMPEGGFEFREPAMGSTNYGYNNDGFTSIELPEASATGRPYRIIETVETTIDHEPIRADIPSVHVNPMNANVNAPTVNYNSNIYPPTASVNPRLSSYNMTAPSVNMDSQGRNIVTVPAIEGEPVYARVNHTVAQPAVQVRTPAVVQPNARIEAPSVRVTGQDAGLYGPSVGVTPLNARVDAPRASVQPVEAHWTTPSVNVPTVQARAPNVDVRAPNVDIRAPNVDVRAPNVDVRSHNVDIRGPNVGVAAPNVDVRAPRVGVAAPNVDVRTPNVGVTAPNVNVRTPNAQVKAPNVDVRAPNAHINAPNVDVRTPNAQVYAPNVEVRAPNAHINAPNVDVRTPNAQVYAPNVDVRAPNAHINAPNIDVRTPNAQVYAPNVDVRAPNAHINAPNIDVRTPNAHVTAPNVDVRAPKVGLTGPSITGPRAEARVDAPRVDARVSGPSISATRGQTGDVHVRGPTVTGPVIRGPDFQGMMKTTEGPTRVVVDPSINTTGNHRLNTPPLTILPPKKDYMVEPETVLFTPYEEPLAFRRPNSTFPIYEGKKVDPFHMDIEKHQTPLPMVVHNVKDYGFGMSHPLKKEGVGFPGHAIERQRNGLYEYKNVYDYDRTRDYNRLYEYNTDPIDIMQPSGGGANVIQHMDTNYRVKHSAEEFDVNLAENFRQHVTRPLKAGVDDGVALITPSKSGSYNVNKSSGSCCDSCCCCCRPKKRTVKAQVVEPRVDVRGPVVTQPRANVEVQQPVIHAPTAQVNADVPRVDVRGPMITQPRANVEIQKPVVRAPEVYVNTPRVDVRGPNVEVQKPVVRAPAVHVEAPRVDANVRAPAAEVVAPRADLNVHGPDYNIRAPRVEVRKPDVQVKAPQIDIKKPDLGTTEASIRPTVVPTVRTRAPEVHVPSVIKVNHSLPPPPVETVRVQTRSEVDPNLNLHMPTIHLPKAPKIDLGTTEASVRAREPYVEVQRPRVEHHNYSYNVGRPRYKPGTSDMIVEYPAFLPDGEVRETGTETQGTKPLSYNFWSSTPRFEDQNNPQRVKGGPSDLIVIYPKNLDKKEDRNGTDSQGQPTGYSFGSSIPRFDGSPPKVSVKTDDGPKAPQRRSRSRSRPDQSASITLPSRQSDYSVDLSYRQGGYSVSPPRLESGAVHVTPPRIQTNVKPMSEPRVDVHYPQISQPRYDADIREPHFDANIHGPRFDANLPSAHVSAPRFEADMPSVRGPNLDASLPSLYGPNYEVDLPSVHAPRVEANVPSVHAPRVEAHVSPVRVKPVQMDMNTQTTPVSTPRPAAAYRYPYRNESDRRRDEYPTRSTSEERKPPKPVREVDYWKPKQTNTTGRPQQRRRLRQRTQGESTSLSPSGRYPSQSRYDYTL